MAKTILVDANRCTGCWTCSQSCKTAHRLDVDEYRMFIRTIGGGGLDKAGGKWPNLYMKWYPVFTTECAKCSGDKYTTNKPFCVYNCPTAALTYGDSDDPESEFSQRKAELLEKGYHAWEQPKWEKTREGIVYMERGI